MTAPKSLKLENQLCFPLYAAAREVVKQYRPFLDAIDLTYTQYIAMMVLWESETASIKELGQRLYLDSGTLTPVVKALETKGLVTRERSAEDERVVMVSLTDAGRCLMAEAKAVPEQIVSCIKLDPADAQQLYRLLYKLLETMK